MSDKNFTLKKPRRFYIIKVDSTLGSRVFYITKLKMSYIKFYFEVGQFIQKAHIKSIKYIGTYLIKDHWSRDTEEIFENSKRVFPQELIETFNNDK
tara:strand:- start:1403 stop:1690 length:288 start_codon:yes stop_codon:yes gene_type:complete